MIINFPFTFVLCISLTTLCNIIQINYSPIQNRIIDAYRKTYKTAFPYIYCTWFSRHNLFYREFFQWEVKIRDESKRLNKGRFCDWESLPGPHFGRAPAGKQQESPAPHSFKFQPHTYVIKRGPIFNEGKFRSRDRGDVLGEGGVEGWKSEKKRVSVWVHIRARVPDIYCGDACTAHIICTAHNSSRSLKLFYYLFYIALSRSSRIPKMK